jgi:hypothetical protein
MSDPIVVPLRSHRQQRAVLAQKLQHLFPAAVLVLAGLQTVTERPRGWALALAIVQIVSGALMLGALTRTVHRERHLLTRRRHAAHPSLLDHPTHPTIEWENLIAAAMVLAEGWEHRIHGGHRFPRPAILTAVVLIVAGLLHGRITGFAQTRRTLRVDEHGLYVPGRRFKARKIHARWADVASIDIGERWAVITTRGGRSRKLDLQDLEAADRVRDALTEANRRRTSTERPAPNTEPWATHTDE